MKLYIMLTLLLSGHLLQAAQRFEVADGDTIAVKIASREVSRITIDGDTKLMGIRHSSQRLAIQSDQSGKDVFIQPHKNAPASFSFFISDSNGASYTLVATQHDIPSETIILKPKKRVNETSFRRYYQSMPHVQHVKQLVKSMALNQSLNGYEQSTVQKFVPLWKEVRIQHLNTWTGMHLLGERYQLQNMSNEVLHLQESEFVHLGRGVLAVSIENLHLDPDAMTMIYMVRRR